MIILAGCRATIEVPPRGSSYDYENEPNDTDYYADYIPGFPFYGVDGYCGAYGDSIDKFYFELSRSGTVNISLSIDNYRSGDLDLTLEDDRFEIDSSEGYGSYEYVDAWLTPGIYYITVFAPHAGSGSGYELRGDFSRSTHAAGEEAQSTETLDLPLKRVDYSPGSKPAENLS
jgi:hypothetical protein